MRLRADGPEGLSVAACARELGISVSHAYSCLNDPDGEKTRALKESYRGTCEVCGAKTDGSSGPGKAPKRCVKHAPRHKKWTREAIVEAIQEFEHIEGRIPYMAEWMSPETRPDWCPHPSQVYRAFGPGGWNKAIVAAGFVPRPPGMPDWMAGMWKPVGGQHNWSPEAKERHAQRMRDLYQSDPDHPLRKGQELERRRFEAKKRRWEAMGITKPGQ